MLETLRERHNTALFQNMNPSEQYWLSCSTGPPACDYTLVFAKREVRPFGSHNVAPDARPGAMIAARLLELGGNVNLDSHESSFREKLIEHMFVAELLKHSWCRRRRQLDLTLMEVSRAEVDRGGYDLIVEHGGILRHVQLKGSTVGAKTSRQDIQVALEGKPSACVVWVFLNEETWELGPFYYLGGRPGERIPPLPAKVGKHKKGDAQGIKKERPNVRTVNKGDFTKLDNVEPLWPNLFGPAGH